MGKDVRVNPNSPAGLRRGKERGIFSSRDGPHRYALPCESGLAPLLWSLGQPRFGRSPWRYVLGAGNGPATEGHVVFWSYPRAIPEHPGRGKATCSLPQGCGLLHGAFPRTATGGEIGAPPVAPPPGVGLAPLVSPRTSCGAKSGGVRSVRHGLRREFEGPPSSNRERGSVGRKPHPLRVCIWAANGVPRVRRNAWGTASDAASRQRTRLANSEPPGTRSRSHSTVQAPNRAALFLTEDRARNPGIPNESASSRIATVQRLAVGHGMAHGGMQSMFATSNAAGYEVRVETVSIGVVQVTVGIVHGRHDGEQDFGPSCRHCQYSCGGK